MFLNRQLEKQLKGYLDSKAEGVQVLKCLLRGDHFQDYNVYTKDIDSFNYFIKKFKCDVILYSNVTSGQWNSNTYTKI